jgi:hypothetical protein
MLGPLFLKPSIILQALRLEKLSCDFTWRVGEPEWQFPPLSYGWVQFPNLRECKLISVDFHDTPLLDAPLLVELFIEDC